MAITGYFNVNCFCFVINAAIPVFAGLLML